MSSAGSRDEMRAAVLRATRRLASRATLFSQAAAERLGLAAIDVECLDILGDEGRLTVGRLAELTGITTGSATRMIDRLEQAGYVRRVADPADRRRVLVERVPERAEALAAVHRPIADAQLAVIDAFDDGQLTVIGDYLEQSVAITEAETERMRAPADEAGGGSFAAPVGGVSSGRIVFLSGAPTVTVRGDASLRELYRARFEGPVPRVRVRGGIVTVAYPRFGWLDWRARVGEVNLDASVHWRRDRGEILLNAGLPWSVELRGGASRLTADLRALRLESFELKGGASRVEMFLPRPSGAIPIRVAGGVSQVAVHRPPGAAVRLEVRGGVSQVSLDGELIRGAGRLSLQSPGAAQAADRFEVEIAGGASKVSIDARG